MRSRRRFWRGFCRRERRSIFTTGNASISLVADEYKVEQPKWELFDIENYEIKADFGLLYGAEFAHLSNEKPHSIFMAKGSEVSVYEGAKL